MNFRDLLSWFSGKTEEKTAPPEPTTGEERRQYFRLNLTDAWLTFGNAGPLKVVNISYGGLRFLLTPETLSLKPKLGDLLEVTVDLGQMRFQTKITIRYLEDLEVGCAFAALNPAHAQVVGDYLRPRLLGNSLHEISSKSVFTDDTRLRLRWFQGEEETQVFLWETMEGEVVKQEFYFLHYMLKLETATNVLQTARLRSTGAKSGFGRIDQSAVVFFQVPPPRALRMGRVILESANLPEVSRNALLNAIAREERRLYARYLPQASQALRFVPAGQEGKALMVANLSLLGIALLLPETGSVSDAATSTTPSPATGPAGAVAAPAGPATPATPATPAPAGPPAAEPWDGPSMEGDLHLGEMVIRVKVETVYRLSHILGGRLIGISEADSERLGSYLAPRLLGQAFEELPPPSEEFTFAPSGARAWLYVGFHNTHLLALVAPENKLVAGRIAFMDQVLSFERGKLCAYKVANGVILPNEWEVPAETVVRSSEVPADLLKMCREMVANARLSEEVRQAWLKVLG